MAAPADPKEEKWGRDGVIKRLLVLEEEGWTLICTDGSAKQGKGWWQAGCGAWFGEDGNEGSLVPTGERQKND